MPWRVEYFVCLLNPNVRIELLETAPPPPHRGHLVDGGDAVHAAGRDVLEALAHLERLVDGLHRHLGEDAELALAQVLDLEHGRGLQDLGPQLLGQPQLGHERLVVVVRGADELAGEHHLD